MQRLLRLARYLAPSAATFLLGTGALFLVDIWIGRMETSARIADWAMFKSLVFPFSTLAMMGIDQVVVREPSKLRTFMTPAVISMAAIAGILALITWSIGAYENIAYLFFGTLLLSLSGFYFGIFRANSLFNMAHVARDGWKLLLLLLIIAAFFTTGTDAQLLMIFACGSVVATSVHVWRKKTVSGVIEQHDEVSDFKSALSVSWPFCVAAFSLSVASYGEILLLKLFHADTQISTYFRAIILFSYPSMVLNTYLVTFLSTFIRQNPVRSTGLLMKFGIYAFPILATAPVMAFFLGSLLEGLVFPGQDTPTYLAVLLSSIAGLRFAYTFLTSFVGTLGNRREIKRVSIIYLLLALAAPLICLPIYRLTGNIIMAVALTAALHWLARGTVGLRLTVLLARRTLSYS